MNFVYFFKFFFYERFFIGFNETWDGVKFIMHYRCICKAQKNETGININLLKTNWGQNLITRFIPALSPHHNAAQAARPSLSPPESTPLSMSVESADAPHHDENEKRNWKKHFSFQKIQTWFFADQDIWMFDIISN